MAFFSNRVGVLACGVAVLCAQSCGSSGSSSNSGGGTGGARAGDSGAAGNNEVAGGSATGGVAGTNGGESGAGQAGADQAGAGQAGDGTGGSGECEPGERSCEGRVPTLCSANGVWESAGSACPFVCTSGSCSGGCVPTATQCADETTRQTCDSSGEWGADHSCSAACVGDDCDGVCVPGARRCDELTRQQCSSDGQWLNDGAPCPVACSAGACTGACTPSQTQCSSNTERQTCTSNHEWGTPVECDYVCVAGACGGVCEPGSVECVPGTPSTQRRTCTSSGQWDAPAACTYVCTGAGVCGGACTPGAKRCTAQQPEQCVDGAWVALGAACSAEQECRPDTATCESCQPLLCGDARNWVDWQTVGPRGDLTDVEIDASGSIYAAGYSYSASGEQQDYFAKFDSNGQPLWAKTGVLANRQFWLRMAIDAAGEIWLVSNAGQVVRYSANGTQQDFDVIQGGAPLWDIKFDASGNVYVAGNSGTGTNRYPFVAKYSSSLVPAWSATHSVKGLGQGVAVDGAGNVYLTGSITVFSGSDVVSSRLLVNRYTASGGLSYTQTTGTCPSDGLYVSAPGAVTDAAGAAYVTGSYCGITTALMEKWSTSGTRLWKQDVPLATSSAAGYELQVKADGNLIGITGNAQIYSHSPSGQVLYTRSYTTGRFSVGGGFDMADADHLVAGGKWSFGSGSSSDHAMVVFKLRLPPNP
jgi:hypothetical protein